MSDTQTSETGGSIITGEDANPLVGILMGSKSDWPDTMSHASKTLKDFGVPHDCRVLSAHRAPHAAAEFASGAAGRGIEVMICGAGAAAHLAGLVAAHTQLPVLGVPVTSKLDGLDSLLSTVQMPAGIPVATLAIGKAGAINAALLAVQILALKRPELAARMRAFREKQTKAIVEGPRPWAE